MTVIIMIDMIIGGIEKDKEIDSIDNIAIIEIIVGIVKDIEIIETIETETDKERDKEIGIETEIDITKTIKPEMHQFHLFLILAICPIIVLDLLVRFGIHDSSLYECLWTSWRTLPFGF